MRARTCRPANKPQLSVRCEASSGQQPPAAAAWLTPGIQPAEQQGKGASGSHRIFSAEQFIANLLEGKKCAEKVWAEQYRDDATASGGLAGNSRGGGAGKGTPRPQILEATVPKEGRERSSGEGGKMRTGRDKRGKRRNKAGTKELEDKGKGQ